MRTIRVADDVWKELQRLAEPFVDEPNTVIRRLLQLPDQQNGKRDEVLLRKPATRRSLGRALSGTILAQSEYRKPILEALAEMGGEGRRLEVLERVLKKVRDRLKPPDHEILPSGSDVRWRKAALWQRHNLMREGLVDSAGRGVWRLTGEGWRATGKTPPTRP